MPESETARGKRRRASRNWRDNLEQVLAAVVEDSNDAIFSRTMDGTVTTWNRAAERMFGYTAADMVGRDSRVMLPPNRADELGKIFGKLKRGERVSCFETERLRRDGSVIHVALTVSPIRNRRHQLTGVSTIARDITEERLAKEALQRGEQELGQLFEHAPFALFCLKRNGTIVRLNEAAREGLGLSEEPQEGQSLSDYLMEPALFHNLLQRLSAGQSVHSVQLRLRGMNGTTRVVLAYANGFWRDNRLVHSYWFLRDITARRRLEQEVLAVSERERERFAHELHDGLGQHLSGVAYLADSLFEELQEKCPEQAARARRLKELVEESIQLTRGVARGLLPVRIEPEGLMLALRELAHQTTAVFRIRCRFACPRTVLVEDELTAAHLYRIAQEAVHNAIRHGKARRIDITLNRNRRNLRLAVRDNGVGMRGAGNGATGMGVHIMNYRAGLCHGRIDIAPGSRCGTTVICSVDLAGSKTAANPPKAISLKNSYDSQGHPRSETNFDRR